MAFDFTKNRRLFTDNIIITRYKFYISLILLNFLTHYLFIFYFKFVSDDWSQLVYPSYSNHLTVSRPYSELIFETQRPLFYIILKTVVDLIKGNALGYHILNFITSTIILLLVFNIAKHLFGKITTNDQSCAFISSLVFLLLFNKDELYAWSTIFPNNMAFIFYLGSLFFYITYEKKTYRLIVSLILFSIAIFIYELGIFLPIFYFIYDWINKKDLKKSLYFGLPLGLYGIIRITNLFGYGWFRNETEFTSPFKFLPVFLNMILGPDNTLFDLTDSFYGLISLNQVILIFLILTDLLIVLLVFKFLLTDLKGCNFYGNCRNTKNLLIISIAGLVISYIPITIRGYIASRHVIFIDFFISLLLAILINLIAKKSFAKKYNLIYLKYIVIFLFLIVNQGLYINWITSGIIQESVDHSIIDNSDQLTQYSCIYINATDLSNAKPNNGIRIYGYKDQLHSPYLNSPGLEIWVVKPMLRAANINLSKTTLIYGTYGDIFISSINTTLTYKNTSSGEYHTINKSECFEFNASNLLTYYRSNQNMSFLFHR